MYDQDDTSHLILESFPDDGIKGEGWDDFDGQVRYADVRRITIVTTDQGPFLPDFFWVFETAGHRYFVEQEDPLSQLLLVHLQKLPGFDNEAVIQASSSMHNAEFLVWENPEYSE